MMKTNLFLLVLLLTLRLCFSDDFPIAPISENDVKSFSLPENGFLGFVYYKSSEVSSNKLSLTFFPQTMSTHPGNIIVYFSKFEDMSNNLTNRPQQCFISAVSSCVYLIPPELNQIYFLLHCVIGDCIYKFRLSHFSEIYLKPNEKEHFIFEDDVQLFNFSIPEKQEFSRLLFLVQYRYIPEENDLIFGSQAIDVQVNSGSPMIQRLGDMQIMIFNNTDQKLCSSCNVTATITSRKKAIIEIELLLYEQNTLTLQLNKTYVDYVMHAIDNKYVLSLDEEMTKNDEFTLMISINSLSGSHKTLYVNADDPVIPPSLSQWRSSELKSYYEEENIKITKADLVYYHLKGNFYYLTVLGNTQGLYSLHVTAQENKILPLQLGVKQSGLIRNKELIYYKVQIWKNDDTKLGLTLSATVMTGHIKVYGRRCGEYDNCQPITLDDISNKNGISIETSDAELSSFKFYPECPYLYCYFIFAVMGNSSSTNTSRYDFVLQKENMFISMIENKCYESQINNMEVVKFKLTVEKTNDDIISVSFIINTELDFFVNRQLICGDDLIGGCKNKIGNLYSPAIYESSAENTTDLAGDYYVYVFGMKSAEFILFPEVQRRNQYQIYIKLLEGKALKYFVNFARRAAYFDFLVDVQEKTKIEINVQSNELNAVKIYLSKGNHEVPSPDSYYLSSSSNYLSFEHDSYTQVIYRVAVEGRVFAAESRWNTSVDFSIMYSTDKTLKHLESNQPYYDNIASNGVKKFILYLDTNNEVVYLSKQIIRPEEYNLDISVSLDRESDPKINYYPYLTEVTGSSMKFKNDKVKQYCSMKYPNMLGRCPIYVTIKNENVEDIYYILTARTKEAAIQLKQGKEQTTRINEEEETISLYFVPTSQDKPVDVYFSSLKWKFDVYASIIQNEESHTYGTWEFPQKNNSQYSFMNKHHVSAILKTADFTKCWPHCIVLFTIKPEKKEESNNIIDDLFHMLVSNGFTELNDNKANQFMNEKGNIKFFKYPLKSIADKRISILIDLTNLAGFSEVYVSLNDNNLDEVYPMKDSFDFFSADGHLSITLESLYQKKNGNSSLLSDLYIGVQCLNNICEGSINARLTYHMVQKVSHGRPYHFLTSQSYDALVFEYYHFTDQNFEFKINKEKGQGTMQMVPCFQFKVVDCMVNVTKEINLHSFSSSKLQVSKSDEHYCNNCIYLVAIIPNKTILSGTFNVVLEKEFLLLPEGRKFYDDLNEEEENYYRCKAPLREEMEIVVNVYHNEPELYVSRKMNYNKKNFEFFAVKNVKPVISLTIPPDFSNFNSQEHDEIYIIVFAKSSSNYSITCKSRSSFTILHAGLIEFAEIKAQQTQTYLFNTNEANVIEHSPKISLGYLTERTFSLLVVLKFRPTKSDEWGNLSDSSYKDFIVDTNNTIFSYNSETFILSNQSGIYELNIMNYNSEAIKYSIAVQTGEINVMPYDTLMDVQILPNEWLYYETYIPKRGVFVLDLVECVGTLDVFTALDHDRLKNHEFDEEFKVFQSQSNLKILKLNQGTLFIAMKLVANSTQSVFGENNVAAFGQLSTHFYDNYNEIPQYRLSVPDDGKMDYFFDFEKMKALVNFKSLYCMYDCDEDFLSKVKVNYTLVASDNPMMLGSHGRCGLVSYQNYVYNISSFKYDKIYNQELDNMSFPLMLQFDMKKESSSYYISVIAKIQGYPNSFTPVSMYYKDLEIKKPELKTQRIIAYGVSIILGIIVVILAFCGCYYYGGYKRLVNRLKYEVKDVDNSIGAVTSLNTTIEMKATRYEGLIMDEKL